MTLSSHSQPIDDGTTVTGTIVFGGACAVDDTIVITDAAGTSKTFTAKGSTTAGSLQFINTDAAAAATALKLCIDNAAGFAEGSITVADNSSGTLTLTLASPGTYRFKNKASIAPASDITNVTSTDFGAGGGAEDIDGHTVAAGGTTGGYNVKSNIKSNIDLVKGIKTSGSKVITKTGTAGKAGVSAASNLSGNIFAYNPNGRAITRSGSDTGFILRGGTATKIAGAASTDHLVSIPGSDTGQRGQGNLHHAKHYHRKGTWATQVFDLHSGLLKQSDGTDKAGITGRGTTVDFAADQGNPTRAIPGELVILFNFASFTTNSVDYSEILG